MNYLELRNYIKSDSLDHLFNDVFYVDDINAEKQRYINLLEKAYEKYGDQDYHFVSSPGRSEVGGNHTDHQHGHVLAASLNIDNICVINKNDSNIINFFDPLFGELIIDISNLDVVESEYNTTTSLVRGIANKLKLEGYNVGGFNCICDSKVLVGSGISSSACFEVMICEAFNCLFNNNKISPKQRAIYSQYAENVYFGKPSGLLDQMSISVGGFVAIDFKNPSEPVIENYAFSFKDYGYDLLLINTKGDHSDLSNEYAAVTKEIKQVANELGVEYLADSSYEELMRKLPEIRKNVNNDRAILRSMHFYREDKRAVYEKECIKNKDIDNLLKLIKGSGHSSFMYLQNVYPASRPNSQSLAIALAITADYLGDEGAYRVHGGGFEGTIQVIIPEKDIEGFKKVVYPVFGDDSILFVKVRKVGTATVI